MNIAAIFLSLCFGGILAIDEKSIVTNETPGGILEGDTTIMRNESTIGTNETTGNWTSSDDTENTTTSGSEEGTMARFSPVDLAHILENDMDSSDPFAFNKSSLDPTIGTHIIAPCMYNKDSFCAQNIPLTSLNAPAVVLDMRGVVWDNATASIRLEDVVQWETINGNIPNGSIVLFETGWSRFWSNSSAYRGSDSTIDPIQFVFPDIDVSVANWLVNGRNFTGVGIDTYSLERGNATEVHEILASHNMFVMENLVNLDYLEAHGTELTVVPLKVQGAGAVPCGVIAKGKGEPVLHPPPVKPEPSTTLATTTIPEVTTASPAISTTESSNSNAIPDSQESSKTPNSSVHFQPANILMILSCIFLGIISFGRQEKF